MYVVHLFFLVFCLINFTFGEDAKNATYESEIYRIQKNLVDKMISDKKVHEIFYQVLEEIFADVNDTNTDVDQVDMKGISTLITVTNRTLYDISNNTEFAKELSFFRYSLELLSPKIFETIKFKDFPNLGQLGNIFAWVAEIGFKDAMTLIRSVTTPGHCKAYDELVTITKGSSAEEYVRTAFDPSLCLLSKETMAKWHQFFEGINPNYGQYVWGQAYSNGWHIFEFAAVAKAYRPTIYDKYFEKNGNGYPVVLTLYNAMKSDAFTKKERAMIENLVEDLNQKFSNYDDPEGRELLTTIKVTEIVKNDSAFLNTFSKIPLLANSGTFFDLIIWISQKSILQTLYESYRMDPTCC